MGQGETMTMFEQMPGNHYSSILKQDSLFSIWIFHRFVIGYLFGLKSILVEGGYPSGVGDFLNQA